MTTPPSQPIPDAEPPQWEVERFERFSGLAKPKHFYFRIRAANGEVVAQSEGYTTREKRDETARAFGEAVFTVTSEEG